MSALAGARQSEDDKEEEDDAETNALKEKFKELFVKKADKKGGDEESKDNQPPKLNIFEASRGSATGSADAQYEDLGEFHEYKDIEHKHGKKFTLEEKLEGLKKVTELA